MAAHEAYAKALRAEADQLAVDLRREDESAHARQSKAWQLKKDEPARQTKSRHEVCFNAYLVACGLPAEDVRDYLRAAMLATDGAQDFRSCADWKMGAFMAGYPAREIARLNALDYDDDEKLALAKRAQRAWLALDDSQRAAGLVLVDRKSGTQVRGQNKASELRTPFVQHLVEIDRLAADKRGMRRLERYALAAAEFLAGIERQSRPSRAEEKRLNDAALCPCGDVDCRHGVGGRGGRHGEPTDPGSRAVRFLGKLEELTDKTIKGEELPYETRLEMFDTALGLLAQKLGVNPADFVHPEDVNKTWTNLGDEKPESDAHSADRDRDFSAENGRVASVSMDKNVSLTDPPGVGVDASNDLLNEEYKREFYGTLRRFKAAGLSHDKAAERAYAEIGEFDDWRLKHVLAPEPVPRSLTYEPDDEMTVEELEAEAVRAEACGERAPWDE
jgi:hypothetical protein